MDKSLAFRPQSPNTADVELDGFRTKKTQRIWVPHVLRPPVYRFQAEPPGLFREASSSHLIMEVENLLFVEDFMVIQVIQGAMPCCPLVQAIPKLT